MNASRAFCEYGDLGGTLHGSLLLILLDAGVNALFRSSEERMLHAAVMDDRLREVLPGGARVARVSENVFAVLLPALRGDAVPTVTAKQVLHAFQNPVPVADDAIVVSP